MSESSKSRPDEYDPITDYHYLKFENRCLRASGDDFQNLFEAIMVRVRPGEFERVRPYGKYGDRKCDGLIESEGIIFQVYSPDELKQAEVQKKIDKDLEGAVQHWQDILKKWVFVYNVKRGIAPDIKLMLQQKRRQYPDIEIDDGWSNDYLWEITRNQLSLQQRCEILGAPPQWKFGKPKKNFYVPSPPPHLLERFTDLGILKNLLLSSASPSLGITGSVFKIGAHGMGGIGKSVLAGMLARDEEVQAAFPDGVFWVMLGQEPILTLRQLDFAQMLGDDSLTFQDVQQGKIYLSQLLDNRECLLILDDVWQVEHIAAFDILGGKSKLLFTTRDSSIVKALNAFEYQVNLLSDDEALELLATCSGQAKATLPVEAHEVMKECGNLPLALSMIGAIAKARPNRWDNLLHKLQNADLDKIRHQFPDYPYPDLLKAIQVSVEALEPEFKIHYLDFAVFPEDVAIPETTLRTFWEPEGLDEYDTQDVVDVLVERSLAQRDEDGNLSLHDLQYDYIRKQTTNLPALHNKLLDAYANQCTQGWHTYPTNDSYFFEHLAHHLKEASRRNELFTLARSSEFAEIQKKVFVNELGVLLKTIQTALGSAIEIDDPPAIAEFLLRHAHHLSGITNQESPLQVLRSGNVDHALKLIELHSSIDSYITWALLVAWELKKINLEEDAQILLKRLQNKLRSIELPNFLSNKRIATWQGDLVAYALAQIFEIDTAGCTVLSQRLLGDSNSRYWAIFEHALRERNLFSEAIKLRKQQKHLSSLVEIAELQAQKVGIEAAESTYGEIIDVLRSWNSPPHVMRSISLSAKKQLEMGYSNLAKRIFTHLVETVDEIRDSNNQVEALLNIADSQIESGGIDRLFLQDASATLHKISDNKILHPSVETKLLEKMAKLSIKLGNVAQAKTYLDQALKIAQTIIGEEVKQVALKHLAETQASSGFIEDALETARMINKHTYRIQAFSYVVSSKLKENDFEGALEIVERDYWDKSQGFQQIAQAQVEAQQFEEAIKIAEHISTDLEQNNLVWTSIVKAKAQVLLKPGYSEQVIDEILETIEQKIIGHQEQAQALMTVAEIQLEQKDFTAGIQTLDRIKYLADRTSAERLLAAAYAKVGDEKQALSIARQIDNFHVRMEALEIIARIQRQTGKADKAREIYTEMLSASTNSDIFSLKAVTLVNIASIQSERGQQQMAAITLQWAAANVERINDLFVKSQLLAFLAESWIQVGEVRKSEQIFQQALELAEKVGGENKNLSSNAQVFTTIAIHKARTGDFDAALEIIEQTPFLPMRAEVYLAMANAQKKIGATVSQQKLQELFADAYEEFQNSSMFWLYDPVTLFCKIAIAQSVVGDKSEAKENLAQLCDYCAKDETNQKVRTERLANISIAFTQISDIDAATSLLTEIEVPIWRIKVLWAIAYAQFRENQIVAVKQSLQLANQTYQKISDESQRAESIGILARIQALAGEPRQAIRSADSALDQTVTLLPAIADIFIELEEVEYFKQLIIPCSYFLESAYEVCQSITQLHPEQASAIADIVGNFHN